MRRFKSADSAYFVTTNPKSRIQFFSNNTICRLFVRTLNNTAFSKDFTVIAYKMNPDHIHLIIKVGSSYDISDIMHSIKRVSSLRINQMISNDPLDPRYRDLAMDKEIISLRKEFFNDTKGQSEIPLFKWQKGFHDRLIKSQIEMLDAINYLLKQTEKHQLEYTNWLCINCIPDGINYLESNPGK